MSAGNQRHQKLIGHVIHADNDLLDSLQSSLSQFVHTVGKLIRIRSAHRDFFFKVMSKTVCQRDFA